MKLRGLELEQFRKFGTRVRLTGFGDRMNVLCGPNEFGKSTILAAIRGLLFERHNSKADPIKRMQSLRGNAAPWLAMDFETGGGAWRIEKRFLSQPMARLTAPDGSRFDNDAAEEELQRLLGFGASGKQGAKPENMGVWGALWVTQRDSVAQADLSSELARSTITSCLDAEVGVLTGNESGQALIREVQQQRAQFLDGNGKPRGRYKDVMIAAAAVAERLIELEARSARLTEDAAALRVAAEKLARESDAAADQRDRDALNEARSLREAALLHEKSVQAAQSALSLARKNRDEAAEELQTRETRAAQLAASDTVLAREQERLLQARADEKSADAVYGECRQLAEAAQLAAAEASATARRLRTLAELVRRSGALARLRADLQAAEAQQNEVAALTARLQAAAMTPALLADIRKAAREHDHARAVLDAQATQVALNVLPEAAGKVRVAGEVMRETAMSLAVVDDFLITIDGIGQLRISPAIKDREKITLELDRARDRLAKMLGAVDCPDAATAEIHFAEREALQRQVDAGRAALERLAPGDAEAGLPKGVDALRQHVAVLEQRLQAEQAPVIAAELPTLAEALAQAAAAENGETLSAEALRLARQEIDTAGETRAAMREAAAAADGLCKAAQAERARLAQEATRAETREPHETLVRRVAMSRREFEGCVAAAAELQRIQPQDSAASMQARIERYEQALALRQQTIRRLRETIAELRARIAQEGGHGLDEQIAAARREQDALVLERDSIERDVKISNVLLQALQAAEQETKERYLAPVVRRVTPYLRSLFPGADIACDDALRITGVTRAALGAEDFERLSDGTQEQIAVLSRLAFAEMLIDQGKPAMVILDDALAYSDAERMERMFDILTQASAKTQILVLTCREDLFSRLGGNRIELTRVDAPAH